MHFLCIYTPPICTMKDMYDFVVLNKQPYWHKNQQLQVTQDRVRTNAQNLLYMLVVVQPLRA